jgi:hypothetical protein
MEKLRRGDYAGAVIAIDCYGRLPLLLCSLAALLTALASSATAEESALRLRAAQEHLARARVHLKFGAVEQGNLAEFDAAQRELDQAGQTPPLTGEVRALRAECMWLREAAGASLMSRFPLVRAVAAARQVSDASYTAPSVVPEMAPRLAVRAAVSQVAKELPSDLVDAFVWVYPSETEDEPGEGAAVLVESETAAVLSALANVTFHPQPGEKEGPAAPAWQAPDAAFAPRVRSLLTSLDTSAAPRNLAIFLVRSRSPAPTDEYWFQAQCRIFDADELAEITAGDPAKVESSLYVSDGLCRDASRQRSSLLLGQAALLLLAMATYAVLLAMRGSVVSHVYDWFVPPLIGYALGVTLPQAVISFMQRFLPTSDDGGTAVVWWPCLAGAFVLLLPAAVYRVGARSLTILPGARRLDGRWGAVLASVACGVAAYWCEPAATYLDRGAFAVLLPFTLSAIFLSYSFGRAVDPGDRFPLGAAAGAMGLALPLGAATFLASPAMLWGCAAATAAFTLVAARKAARGPAVSRKSPELRPFNAEGTAPHDLAELRALVESPFYVSVAALDEARQICGACDARKTVWLAICGPTGSGKSALVDRVVAERKQALKTMRVLAGSCRAESPPYEPFREALAEVWETVAPASLQPEMAGVDSVFDELAGLFVPYWSLLSSVARPGQRTAASPTDLNAAISQVLAKLTKRQPLALVLDDAQWLDEGSAALVRQLHRRFPPGGAAAALFVLVARDRADLDKLELGLSPLAVAPPTRDGQVALLEHVLGVEPGSARAIVRSLGAVSEEPGGIFWLSRTLLHSLDEQALVPSEHGFVLRDDFLKPGRLPLPGKLRETLAERLHQSSDDLLIVECAALLGQVFRVSVLANSLGRDRLDLLQALHRLERESRLFEDVPDDDDEYAFSSLFMFQVVRELLELDGDDVSADKPHKIVKELHAHIARAVENAETLSASDLFDLAERYAHAGSFYAAKAMDYSLRASRVARSQFGYGPARRYLDMANKASQTAGKPFDERKETLFIDCDEAHVTGRNRIAAAEGGWRFVEDHSDCGNDVRLLVARAGYDAGRDTGDALWFERAAQLAQEVRDAAGSELERAEACHLLGISLPLSQRAERTAQLRAGLETLHSPTSPAAFLLKARLLGSLAEQLSYGTSAEREEARSLFQQGLELRVAGRLGDLPGQARAHGGLGRLAFFGDPPDYATARVHFMADLAIAEQIGDVAGQSLVHSFLGKCDLAIGDLAEALRHFAAAKERSQSTKDTLFALAGMLECSLLLGCNDDIERIGEELAQLARAVAVPRDCAEEIARVLKAVEPGSRSWARLLTP